MLLHQRREVSSSADPCYISGPVSTAGSDLSGALYSRLYNLLWYPALPVALVAARADPHSRRERLGSDPSRGDKISDSKFRVWVHAASVGEIEGVRPVIQLLASLRPDLEFVITTMTPAGRDAAGRRLNGNCQLAPFDHPGTVRAFIARIRPILLIITETELWPNFFLQSAAVGAKIALINARLSRRSMRGYRLIRPLIARALRRADVILAQTATDAERFRSLGAPPQRLAVGGNAKYEVLGDSPPLTPALASFAEGRPILVAGSTAPGEEQIVLTAYRHLLERFPSLALVLAPRHLHRIDEVERILQGAELSYIRASKSNLQPAPSNARRETSPESPIDSPIGNAPDRRQAGWVSSGDITSTQDARCCGEVWRPSHSPFRVPVLLLDTMGDLRALYQRAAIAFIGGSLRPGRGGQSLAEPASASVPLLFGPYYENHRQLGDALIAAASGMVVREATQLADASAKWLADEPARRVAGQGARSVLEELAGSSTIIVRNLCGLLPTS